MIDCLAICVGICAVCLVTWVITSIHYTYKIDMLNRELMDYFEDEDDDDDEDSYFHNEYFDDDEEDDED